MAFSEACFGTGVQPIIGAMLGVALPPSWAANRLLIGWRSWRKTIKVTPTFAVLLRHLDRPIEQEPHIELALLEGFNEGLIALMVGSKERSRA